MSRRVYTVLLELSDEDERFVERPEDLVLEIQGTLDDFGSNAADETFDDKGRISMRFVVAEVESTDHAAALRTVARQDEALRRIADRVLHYPDHPWIPGGEDSIGPVVDALKSVGIEPPVRSS